MSKDQLQNQQPTLPQQPWRQQMCPILSIASLNVPKQESSRIVAVGTPQSASPSPHIPEAIGCQGPQCSWFVSIANEKGEIVSGGCAIALLVPPLSGIAAASTMAAQTMMQSKGPIQQYRPYPIKEGH
jgi:hypothetical protein